MMEINRIDGAGLKDRKCRWVSPVQLVSSPAVRPASGGNEVLWPFQTKR